MTYIWGDDTTFGEKNQGQWFLHRVVLLLCWWYNTAKYFLFCWKNMKEKNKLIVLFENQPVRRVWDEKEEKWYFSVVDIVAVLTDSVDPRKYWNQLVQRLRDEGSELVTKCHQLKFVASDGKYYASDAADVEILFSRVILPLVIIGGII